MKSIWISEAKWWLCSYHHSAKNDSFLFLFHHFFKEIVLNLLLKNLGNSPVFISLDESLPKLSYSAKRHWDIICQNWRALIVNYQYLSLFANLTSILNHSPLEPKILLNFGNYFFISCFFIYVSDLQLHCTFFFELRKIKLSKPMEWKGILYDRQLFHYIFKKF